MVVAVVVSVAAEARIAGVVAVLQWLLDVCLVMDWLVVVVMVVNRDGHWDLHWNRDGSLHWDVLLNGHWVGAIDRVMNWNWHWLLNSVWDALLDVVGLRNRDLDWVWDWFLNRDRVGTVHWDLHFNWDRLLHGVRDGFLHWDRVWGRDGDWVGTVNRNLNFNWDLLLDGVRHWDWHFNLHGHLNVLDHLVGLGNGNLDRDGHLLFHGVRLRHQHLDGVWTVDWNVHWVRNLLLHCVWSWHTDWDFHVLLIVDWNVLQNFVWLWNRYFHWIWDALFDSVRHMFRYSIWHWYSLQQGYGFGHIGVFTNEEALSVTISVNWSRLVSSSQVTMSTNVAHIQTIDSVPIAQIQQSTFVQLFLQWHCIGARFLLI